MIPGKASEAALAKSLRRLAKEPAVEEESSREQWERMGRQALIDTGMQATPEQVERAWRTLWQRSFIGGNYTLDARAMIKAIRSQP